MVSNVEASGVNSGLMGRERQQTGLKRIFNNQQSIFNIQGSKPEAKCILKELI